MELLLSSGLPVELAFLFEEGYVHFYGTDTRRSQAGFDPRTQTSDNNKGKKQHARTKRFRKYVNVLDQIKAANPEYSAICTNVMRSWADRFSRYYSKHGVIGERVFRNWCNPNMPYVLLSSKKVAMADKRRVIKVHKTDVTHEYIDLHLARGDVVRLTELPEEFVLNEYEVYGDGTIEHDSIIGDVSLMKHTPRMDILSRRFAKRDPSEYASANGKLDWLVALEQMVAGDVISTAQVRKAITEVPAHSIWYNVTARVITSTSRPPTVYSGTLVSAYPLTELPAYVAKGEHMTFVNNFITSSDELVKLEGMDYDTRIEIVRATPNSDGMKGNVGYGLTTLKLEPKKLYYLVGRKGSGKTTKLNILRKVANVEDSDDYGVFLTEFLSATSMLNVDIETLMDWVPDPQIFKRHLESFLTREHDYEREKSYFHILAGAVLQVKMEPAQRTYRILRFINQIMGHPYIGVQRYAALRARYDDITKPTFVMCHSFSETSFRPTPDDTIMLSDVIDAWGVIRERTRGQRKSSADDEAEALLYFAYAEGISTINKLAPFALIIEQLRRECGDATLGCLQIASKDTS